MGLLGDDADTHESAVEGVGVVAFPILFLPIMIIITIILRLCPGMVHGQPCGCLSHHTLREVILVISCH